MLSGVPILERPITPPSALASDEARVPGCSPLVASSSSPPTFTVTKVIVFVVLFVCGFGFGYGFGRGLVMILIVEVVLVVVLCYACGHSMRSHQ